THSPRAVSRLPRLDAVSPLPSEEATPPVTKMYLVVATGLHHSTRRVPAASAARRGASPLSPAGWRMRSDATAARGTATAAAVPATVSAEPVTTPPSRAATAVPSIPARSAG